jgi:hypothetical protein
LPPALTAGRVIQEDFPNAVLRVLRFASRWQFLRQMWC